MATTTTPFRETRLEIDIDETVVIEGPWGGVRTGRMIAENVGLSGGRGDNQYASGVRYWSGSGTWTLQPLQERMSQFHERFPTGLIGDDIFYTLGTAADTLSSTGEKITRLIANVEGAALANTGVYHTRSLPGTLGFEVGVSALDGILDRGDSLYKKRVEAGKTWAQAEGFNIPEAPQNQFDGGSPLIAGLPAANIKMDAQAKSHRSQRADQGFFLRWSVPGTQHQFPDYVLNFYFGQFCVAIQGDGSIKLLEYCSPAYEEPRRWVVRMAWRYCKPGEAVGNTHTLLIYPQIGPFGDKYIHFANNQLDAAGVYGPSAETSEISFISDEVSRQGDIDESGDNHVTTEAPIRLDHRRDIQLTWQISKLLFVASGSLRDMPFPRRVTRDAANTAIPFDVFVQGYRPENGTGEGIGGTYDLRAHVYDVETKEEYDRDATGTWDVQYPAAEIKFEGQPDSDEKGASEDTPVLYSYKMWQDSLLKRLSPGMVGQVGILDVSVEGADREPQNERCVVSLHDPVDLMQRLRRRGELSARVVVEAIPPGGGPSIDVVLFRGYIMRPSRTQIGRSDAYGLQNNLTIGEFAGAFGGGPPTVHLSPEQSRYDCNMVGMWRALSSDRRSMAQAGMWHRYAIDELAAPDPKGAVTPWRVTDIIKDILRQAGFDSSMVNIADSPIRLWAGIKTLIGDFELTFQTDMLAQLVRLSSLYLGQVLIFDPNAGTEGQWRLTRDAGSGQTPLFHFHSFAPYSNYLPHAPEAWALGHGFAAGPLTSYTVAPEYNRIRVITSSEGLISGSNQKKGSVSSEIINYNSYSPPGSTLGLDPLNPHYIGHEQMYLHVDPTLMGTGKRAYEDGRRACDYTALRLFDLIGKARQIQPLHAPLYLVADPETERWRFMRYGDSVTFDGVPFTVRNVNPQYNLDSHQTAYYELERVIPTTY